MNLWKKLKKLFHKSKETKRRPHCENCYNSIEFFENPSKEIEKIDADVGLKTKSIHVHHYTPYFSITEILTDDETSEMTSNKPKFKCSHSESNMKVYHHKHYDAKKVKRKCRERRESILKLNKLSDFLVDNQETYENCPITNRHTKNWSLFYIKTSPFSTCFYPNIIRKL